MDPPPQGQTSPSPAWLGVGDAPPEQRARKGVEKRAGKAHTLLFAALGAFFGDEWWQIPALPSAGLGRGTSPHLSLPSHAGGQMGLAVRCATTFPLF